VPAESKGDLDFPYDPGNFIVLKPNGPLCVDGAATNCPKRLLAGFFSSFLLRVAPI
jgi:hypothetical protein